MSKSLIIPAGAVRLVPSGGRGVAVEEKQLIAPEERARRQRAERQREQQMHHQQELDRIRREEREAARREYEQQLDTMRKSQLQQCGMCGQHFDTFMENMKHEVGRQLVDMSLKVAEVILCHALPDREMVSEILRETLEPVSDLQGAKVRMNPDDLAALKASREEGRPLLVTDRVELVADETLNAGDITIESRNGYFDARIEQRLRLLEERMKERYQHDHRARTET